MVNAILRPAYDANDLPKAMYRFLAKILLTIGSISSIAFGNGQQINIINDVSHHYSFFYAWSNAQNFGGKHGYVDWENNQQFQQSQATLSSLDLSNYNLFNLVLDQKHDLPYFEADIETLKSYVNDGGGLFVFPAIAKEGAAENCRKLLKRFGADISDDLSSAAITADSGEELDAVSDHHHLIFANPKNWEVLARDAESNPVVAIRKKGNGHIAVASFSSFVRVSIKGKTLPPGYKFPNYAFAQRLIKRTAAGKTVTPNEGLMTRWGSQMPTIWPDKVRDMGAFRIRHTDYSAHIVDKVLEDYKFLYPILEDYMGVPMVSGSAEGEKFTIDLLAVAGSGVSRGKQIGIAMFKENFYGILGHELTHSWVVPHPEPLSNEGIAIHVGSTVSYAASKLKRDKKHMDFHQNALAWRIKGALEDPQFDEWDPAIPQDTSKYSKTLMFGKYIHLIAELKKNYGADVNARYFRMKRKYVPAEDYRFTTHDSVWLWSQATGEDQFPFFNKAGISIDRSKVRIPGANSLDSRVFRR